MLSSRQLRTPVGEQAEAYLASSADRGRPQGERQARTGEGAGMADGGTPQIRKAWDMVDEAKKDIDNLSVEQVKAELDAGSAVIVDIRDFRELYLKAKIPVAFHADRGMIEFWVDPASEYYRDLFTPDKRFILYCAGGGRSA